MPFKLLLLLPPDLPQSDDPEEQKAYKKAVSSYLKRLALAIMTISAAITLAATPIGFARASEVTDKIEEAVKPVRDEQAKINTALIQLKSVQERDSRRLAMSLSNALASEMRFLQSKRCKEPDVNERDRLYREIDRKQEEYSELRGISYNVPRCSEL